MARTMAPFERVAQARGLDGLDHDLADSCRDAESAFRHDTRGSCRADVP
jgi:hypothetical protein